MTAYYNENDRFAAAWLRALIAEGLIADGEVDERSIEQVKAKDLEGFAQCHFFAGIGIWSYALRQAGWRDDRPVWTGSCPCPSFSAAGQGKGFDDPRHLWPAWSRLIGECKPATIFGEQVDDAIGHGWLDLVQTDLEGEAYSVGKAVFGACSVGAPQIGRRLYFVATTDTTGQRERTGRCGQENSKRIQSGGDFDRCCKTDELGTTKRRRREQRNERQRPVQESDERSTAGSMGTTEERGLGMRGSSSGSAGRIAQPESTSLVGETLRERRQQISGSTFSDEATHGRKSDSGNIAAGSGSDGLMGEAERERLERHTGDGNNSDESGWLASRTSGPTPETSPLSGFWRDAEWLYCTDGKYRPIEPGTFPLAHGHPNRVGTLRGYGNALCAPQAQAFIEAFLDVTR